MDKEEAKAEVAEKAEEEIRLPRRELWWLKIAAATGVMSFISHGISAITWLVTHVSWPF